LNSYGSGYAAPFFYDNNGNYELFLGHELGGIIHLGNIDANITGIYDTLSLEFENIFNGKFSTIAIADFDGDDTLDYLVGNVRGGFSLYTYESQDTVISNLNEQSQISNSIELFPNPNSGVVNLKFQSKPSILSINVYDRIGRELLSSEVNNPELIHKLNLSQLSSDLYFIEIRTDKNRQAFKVLKQ